VCVTEAQTHACDGRSMGAFCEFDMSQGTCVDGVCLVEDPDADGLSSTADNCPLTPNVSQADEDNDGFGDACDRCPDLVTKRNHDEDGDSYGDECDRCPGIADFQDDPDGDGISKACEPLDGEKWELLAFESFEKKGTWAAANGQVWVFDGETAAPISLLAPTDLGLGNLLIQLRSYGRIVIDLGFTSTDDWHAGDRIGVALTDANGTRLVSSEIVCKENAGSATPVCEYRMTFSTGSVGTDDRTVPWAMSRYRASFDPMNSGGTISGHADGDAVYPAFGGSVPFFTSSVYPVVSASPTIRLRYFAAWAARK